MKSEPDATRTGMRHNRITQSPHRCEMFAKMTFETPSASVLFLVRLKAFCFFYCEKYLFIDSRKKNDKVSTNDEYATTKEEVKEKIRI
jgi:hypothetical protein